jgi:uncharacterized alkaline shock family protein YloU
MMNQDQRVAGSTTIAPEVIETIIRMTAMETPGINRVPVSNSKPPVRISVDAQTVNADVYVILDYNQNILDIGKRLQENFSRAISETIGMKPGLLNVHIVDFEPPTMTDNGF